MPGISAQMGKQGNTLEASEGTTSWRTIAGRPVVIRKAGTGIVDQKGQEIVTIATGTMSSQRRCRRVCPGLVDPQLFRCFFSISRRVYFPHAMGTSLQRGSSPVRAMQWREWISMSSRRRKAIDCSGG